MSTERTRRGSGLALAASGGLLLWFLMRGDGWGFGKDRGEGNWGRPVAAPVRVRVDDRGITVDGDATDIDGAVARARISGSAILTVTGAARSGTVADLAGALLEAGVLVASNADVHELASRGGA